jgi:hypothetical protein
MGKYGRVFVSGGLLTYQPGNVDAAVPRGPWSIPIPDVWRVTEKTFPAGPVFDWFIIFSVKNQEFAIPTEAFEDEGLEDVLKSISAELGAPLELGLANCADLAEREMFQRD